MYNFNTDILTTPQISQACASLTPWWKERCIGVSVLNRDNSIHFDIAFPLYNTYERIDELFSLLGLSLPPHARTVFDSFYSNTFDVGVQYLSESNVQAKWWSIRITNATNPDKSTFELYFGAYDESKYTDERSGNHIRDEAMASWFEGFLPNPISTYTQMDDIEHIKFVYNKADGTLKNAKFFSDTRNILFDCTTSPWNLLSTNLEICITAEGFDNFIDPSNIVPEVQTANTGNQIISYRRNNHATNSGFVINPNQVKVVSETPEESEETQFIYVTTELEMIGNVDIKLEQTANGYSLIELSNLYANGEPTGWYSANTLDDVRIA